MFVCIMPVFKMREIQFKMYKVAEQEIKHLPIDKVFLIPKLNKFFYDRDKIKDIFLGLENIMDVLKEEDKWQQLL